MLWTWIRTPVISVAAIAATLSLFAIMHHLITSEFRGARILTDPVQFNFVRLEEKDLSPTKREMPKKMDPPKKPEMPETPPMQQSQSSNQGRLGFASATPFNLDISGTGDLSAGWARNRDPVPILRVTPVYPTRASRRGLEGWVEVAFTITTTGATDGVRVVAEEPSGVFSRAAIRAVQKWKYKPQVVDGEPQPRHDVRVVLKFQLEE